MVDNKSQDSHYPAGGSGGESGSGGVILDHRQTGEESPSDAVLSALADSDSNQGSMTDLPPMYDVVDLDALDGLFGTHADGYVSFTYQKTRVIVHSDGTVVLREPDQD